MRPRKVDTSLFDELDFKAGFVEAFISGHRTSSQDGHKTVQTPISNPHRVGILFAHNFETISEATKHTVGGKIPNIFHRKVDEQD
jgi:hypothetical protein